MSTDTSLWWLIEQLHGAIDRLLWSRELCVRSALYSACWLLRKQELLKATFVPAKNKLIPLLTFRLECSGLLRLEDNQCILVKMSAWLSSCFTWYRSTLYRSCNSQLRSPRFTCVRTVKFSFWESKTTSSTTTSRRRKWANSRETTIYSTQSLTRTVTFDRARRTAHPQYCRG